MGFLQKAARIWKLKDLRVSILFVLAMLVIARVAAHIPIPGVNAENVKLLFQSNQVLGLLNLFSGGTMSNFSVVALGVAPYITASIIFQLLGMVIPRLEAIMKEGESGQRRINQWTRLAAVPLAFLQGYGMITLLRQSTRPILNAGLSAAEYGLIMLTLTAGTIFLMWIGELISERKIGNGISLLIFVGIISSLPAALSQAAVTFDRANLPNLILFAIVAFVTIMGVVVITDGQRNIPVSYARHVRGQKMYGGVDTHLPLRVNVAGVIPIIFAISFILFPSMIAQFFIAAKSHWVAGAAQWVIHTAQNQLVYGISYFILVFAFTYFYTAVVFQPTKIAEGLQKQGGFVPGIRPGKSTSDYLGFVMNRIMLAGALFLGVIAVLPLLVQQLTGTRSLVVGGTSILIVVSVILETIKQIEAQLTMHDYGNL